jgi:hypothetical protein
MPKVIYDIPGIKDSVQRPVAFDIVRQIMEWTGLPATTNIRYAGETEKVHQPASTVSGEAEFNSFNSDLQWTVTVIEDAQQDRILSTAVMYDDNPHIFYDGKIGAYIRPAYTPVDVTLNVSARFPDKDAAIRWRENIRTRVSTGRDIRVHSASYSYLIPAECLYILKEIHRMREAVAPYGENYDTYFGNHITKKATVLTDMVGKNQAWAIAETQAKIVGWFEFEGEPEKGDKDSETSAWDLTFSYKFKYDRATACFMEYPLMVHNQLMSTKFRDTGPPPNLDSFELNYSMSSRLLAAFETSRLPSKHGLPGIALPSYDEFLPSQVLPDTLRLITCLTSIDPSNLRNILSLTDFDDYLFTPEILAFLPGEAAWLNKTDKSIFSVSVYDGCDLMQFDRYEVTSALMVRMTEDPSLRHTYHVRVGVHLNPRMLGSAARERLRNNYAVAKQVFWSLRPELKTMGLPGISLPGNVMTHQDFNKCIEYIDRIYTVRGNGQLYQHNTVMSLFVEANRRT